MARHHMDVIHHPGPGSVMPRLPIMMTWCVSVTRNPFRIGPNSITPILQITQLGVLYDIWSRGLAHI